MTHSQRFVNYLLQLKEREERASLARLKRGLIHQTIDFEALAVIGPLLPSDASRRDIQTYLLVAMLFALHQKHTPEGNFGHAVRNLHQVLTTGQQSLEERFGRLLNARREDLPLLLRQFVQQMQSKDIPIPYHELLNDLHRWDHSERWTQQKWARAYWQKLDKQSNH